MSPQELHFTNQIAVGHQRFVSKQPERDRAHRTWAMRWKLPEPAVGTGLIILFCFCVCLQMSITSSLERREKGKGNGQYCCPGNRKLCIDCLPFCLVRRRPKSRWRVSGGRGAAPGPSVREGQGDTLPVPRSSTRPQGAVTPILCPQRVCIHT